MNDNYNDYSLRYLLFDHPNTEIRITQLDWSGDLKLKVIQRNDKCEMIRGYEIGVPEDLALCVCDEYGHFKPIGYDILFGKLDSIKEEDTDND